MLLPLAVLLLAMMMPMTMIGVTATTARPSCQTSGAMPIIMVWPMIGAGYAGLVLVEPDR